MKRQYGVFISHSTKDKQIADLIVSFLIGIGVRTNDIFCSSRPGNDVSVKISDEVKQAIKESSLNISILSKDFYDSVYCLNEAGIFWYRDGIPVILVALPEIGTDDMKGFLGREYITRRLESKTDIFKIYDTVREAIDIEEVSASILNREIDGLMSRYATYIETKKTIIENKVTGINAEDKDLGWIMDISTDEEKVLVFYIMEKKARKVSFSEFGAWLTQNEIYNINIESAFDLLASIGEGTVTGEQIILDIDFFRNILEKSNKLTPVLEKCVDDHTLLASTRFAEMEKDGDIDSSMWLFIAYLSEHKVATLGDRWMAESQIEDIRRWEKENSMDSFLSNQYEQYLNIFKQENFVYASDWTSYGNAKEYTIHKSLLLLLGNIKPFETEISKAKELHFDIPF